MTKTTDHRSGSVLRDQPDSTLRHVVRDACRAELRAWLRAATKPSRLVTATVTAVTIGGIAAAGATIPGASAATSPTASARPAAEN